MAVGSPISSCSKPTRGGTVMRSGGLGLGARRWLLSALVPAGIALGALITLTDVSWGQVQAIVELKDGYAKTTVWYRATEILRVGVDGRHGVVVVGTTQR